MSYVITKKDKAGNVQYLSNIKSASELPETLTPCEKSGVCPLPGWAREIGKAVLFENENKASDLTIELPRITTYTVAEYQKPQSINELLNKL